MREREDANRTREAGHLDEIQGVAAITMESYRNGAVGFIDWLDADFAIECFKYPCENLLHYMVERLLMGDKESVGNAQKVFLPLLAFDGIVMASAELIAHHRDEITHCHITALNVKNRRLRVFSQ